MTADLKGGLALGFLFGWFAAVAYSYLENWLLGRIEKSLQGKEQQ